MFLLVQSSFPVLGSNPCTTSPAPLTDSTRPSGAVQMFGQTWAMREAMRPVFQRGWPVFVSRARTNDLSQGVCQPALLGSVSLLPSRAMMSRSVQSSGEVPARARCRRGSRGLSKRPGRQSPGRRNCRPRTRHRPARRRCRVWAWRSCCVGCDVRRPGETLPSPREPCPSCGRATGHGTTARRPWPWLGTRGRPRRLVRTRIRREQPSSRQHCPSRSKSGGGPFRWKCPGGSGRGSRASSRRTAKPLDRAVLRRFEAFGS